MPQATTHAQAQTRIEQEQRFSRSRLWQIQRHFFAQQGIQAWQRGTVPHYITSNPYIAKAYAQVVLGFLRDYHTNTVSNPVLEPDQPVYIVELGAGSGRFAYHFLKTFHAAHSQSSINHLPITYVLTDFAEQNLSFWETHPALQPFFEQGLLDVALYDAEQNQDIALRRAGTRLGASSLKHPLIVIANYVLDSIPQDLFVVEDGHIFESRVSLSSPQDESDLNDPELLQRLNITYSRHPLVGDFYNDPALDHLLMEYQQTLTDTYLLFPHIALQCLNHLRRLGSNRLLFLSGDKGHGREADLLFRSEPHLALHGSFSMMVNYHAIGQYVEQNHGTFLTIPHRHNSLNICAALFGDHPHDHPETRLAFTQAIIQSNPDDFFALKKVIEKHTDTLSIKEILAYLRLSNWDTAIFLSCFPRIMAQIDDSSVSLREDVFWAAQHIWENYYPIGEPSDLPFYLGMLLYTIEYYPEAIGYLEQSRQLYGDDPNTLYNLGMCYYRLRQLTQALDCLTQALALKPDFEAAKAMRIKLRSEAARRK